MYEYHKSMDRHILSLEEMVNLKSDDYEKVCSRTYRNNDSGIDGLR